MKAIATLALLCVVLAAAEVYYKETFDSTWEKRWVPSDWKKSEGTAGTWAWSASQWYGDAEADKGIQTSQDARFYAISSKISEKPLSNEGKTLVVQFSVKFPQKIDCGGGYIKLLPSTLDQKKFSGESDYAIMFGPDICGTSTRKVHVIFTYKGKNLLTKKDIKCETDQLTHVYTLIVKPDNTYEVLIDGVEKAKGSLYEDWDFLPPKEIPDPSKSKPADWVDDEKIPDPEAEKPAGWDDIPATIPDPDAEKPEDWDEDSDGEWEPPTIPNPEYKGEWKAPLIDNPDYKGPWIHPKIANPDYFDDDKVYLQKDLQYVGIELWQVKSGTLFDNIIVTNDVEAAKKLRDDTFFKTKDAEKKMFDDLEEAKRKEEEEKRKKAEAEKPKTDDIDDDDEEIADVLDDKDEL